MNEQEPNDPSYWQLIEREWEAEYCIDDGPFYDEPQPSQFYHVSDAWTDEQFAMEYGYYRR